MIGVSFYVVKSRRYWFIGIHRKEKLYSYLEREMRMNESSYLTMS
jgi:hypothetical protein